MYLDKSTFIGKNAVGYLRKSTDDDYRQKYSIQSQQEQMDLWAHQFGVVIKNYYIDDHSAKDFRRPGWESLMKFLTDHHNDINLVLVIDFSRFSRNDVMAYVYINQLDQWNIELQAIDQLLNYQVPESLIMRGNYITMPAVDNKWRSIKVKRGMIQSLKSGNWCAGKYPKGYWKDKNTGEIHITDEGNFISEAFKKIAYSDYNIRDAQVFLSVRGYKVSFKNLSEILRNPFYKGYISHSLLGKEVVKGNHPAIVDVKTWDLVQNRLTGNKKSSIREDLYPLKGFLYCPNCGNRYTGYQVKKKQKKDGSYRIRKSFPIYYKCSCSNISGKLLHEEFKNVLHELCIHHDYVYTFRTELTNVFNSMQYESMSTSIALKKKIANLNTTLDKLEEKFINDSLDGTTYKKHLHKTKKSISLLEKELKKHSQLSNPKKFVDHSMKLLTKMPVLWQDSDISAQKRLQNLVFPAGIYYDKEKGQYRTPKLNSIFSLSASFSVYKKEKTSHHNNEKLVFLPGAVPTFNKSNPSYIEDFINISETLLE